EITNNSHFRILLPVGMRVGQIVFQQTAVPTQSYADNGKYQTVEDLDELKAKWKPSDMLSALWLDWELRSRKK
ncbi:hypothetical protein KBD68_04240, partial [Candidatus Woesebacteria bacterium]|nr:hypothetical protein [Candidatus Woesebacteria bacterium]